MHYKQFLLESREKQVASFAKFVKDYLGLDSLPEIVVINNPQFSIDHKTFGCFDLQNDIIKIQVANRHPLDIFRTDRFLLTYVNNAQVLLLEGLSPKVSRILETLLTQIFLAPLISLGIQWSLSLTTLDPPKE
jgi:hypothetical protein